MFLYWFGDSIWKPNFRFFHLVERLLWHTFSDDPGRKTAGFCAGDLELVCPSLFDCQSALFLSTMNQQQRVSAFVDVIWDWYARHKRTLPWRDLKITDDTQRAYMVLVSEIMLQQTQVSRVQIVFKRFLESFPTIRDLAAATNSEVILAWRGMGYNSRVLRLRDAARTIVTGSRVSALRVQAKNAKLVTGSKRVTFPQSMEELLSIPGIGHYTAGAIRNFAFQLPTACIDTNIRRILHRTFVGPENSDGTFSMSDKELMKIAEQAMMIALDGKKNHTSADWYAALMDFGSLVQTKNNPKWDICPLSAKNIMKATRKNFPKSFVRGPKSEPGRSVGGKHIPNRIFRGRIVESLRDHGSLSLEQIGANISVDWDPAEHREWLQGLLKKLTVDRLVDVKGKKYLLAA